MDPITTSNPEETTPATATETISDPVVLFPYNGEQYQLVYDFHVNKTIARHLGINPMMQGFDQAIQHPDGLEIILWACLSQMGLGHQVPKEQRHLKLKTVTEWIMDPDVYFDATRAVVHAFNKFQPKRQPKQEEGEESHPPEN